MNNNEIEALKKINRHLFQLRRPKFESIEDFRRKYLKEGDRGRSINHLPVVIALFPGGWNGAGGMVHHFNLAIHKQAADWYCKKYYIENGELPVGEHSFEVRYGKGGNYDIVTPFGDSSGVKTVSMKFELCWNDLDESFIKSLFVSLYYRVRW